MSEDVIAYDELKINDDAFNGNSISGLADRPNTYATSSGGGLSAADLKKKFDANPDLIRKHFNQLIEYIGDGTVADKLKAKYVKKDADGNDVVDTELTLAEILKYILNGELAEKYLMAHKNSAAAAQSLDEILTGIDAGKLDKGSASWSASKNLTIGGYVNAESFTAESKERDESATLYHDSVHVLQKGKGEEEYNQIAFLFPSKPSGEETIATMSDIDEFKKMLQSLVHTRELWIEAEGKTIKLYPDGHIEYLQNDEHLGEYTSSLRLPLESGEEPRTLATREWVEKLLNNTSFISDVEDYKEGDKHYIKLTFDNGKTITEELDVIFGGVSALLELKANATDVASKADKTYVDEKLNEKLDKTTEASKIYGTDADKNQTTYAVSGRQTAGIAIRRTGGHITLPSVPEQTIDAACKGYVDTETAKKLSIDSTPMRVYTTGGTGTQSTIPFAVAAEPSSIPIRDVDGLFKVAETPIDYRHVASKNYVDRLVGKLEGLLVKETVDYSVAYEKLVPKASAQRAILSRIGGASKVCNGNNLCTGVTEDGIRWTDTGSVDYACTVPKGTYTATLRRDIFWGEVDREEIFVNGEQYDNPATFTVDGDATVAFHIEMGANEFGNYEGTGVLYPMINVGTTSLPFEPYIKPYIVSAPVTDIVTEGKNLIPFPYYGAYGVGYTTTNNGITWTVNYDGSVTANGTASANSPFILISNVNKSNIEGKVVFSGAPVGSDWDKKNHWIAVTATKAETGTQAGFAIGEDPRTIDILKGSLYVQLVIGSGYTANNVTFYPKMVYEADTHQYHANELFDLPGYGEGNPDNPKERNEVDFINEEYHHRGNLTEDGWVPLEREEIYPISSLLTWLKDGRDYVFIDVEGGGTVRFENEKKLPVPSEIHFAEV